MEKLRQRICVGLAATTVFIGGVSPAAAEDGVRFEISASCRVEQPILVHQPEINSRVVVAASDTARYKYECIDLSLSPFFVSGSDYIEALPAGATSWVQLSGGNSWFTSSPNGIANGGSTQSLTFESGHWSLGRPHRACIVIFEPNSIGPVCETVDTPEPIRVGSGVSRELP